MCDVLVSEHIYVSVLIASWRTLSHYRISSIFHRIPRDGFVPCRLVKYNAIILGALGAGHVYDTFHFTVLCWLLDLLLQTLIYVRRCSLDV